MADRIIPSSPKLSQIEVYRIGGRNYRVGRSVVFCQGWFCREQETGARKDFSCREQLEMFLEWIIEAAEKHGAGTRSRTER